MRILALDTTSVFGSIALLEDGRTVEEMPLHSPDGFSQTLFGHIRALLERHEWELGTVGCFAATAGPGSFTGVRVGLTAVKGLAEAMGARAYGVSNLQALAACGSAPLRAVVTDARRSEVYGAVYNAALETVVDEAVLPYGEWLRGLPAGVGEVVTTDFTPFRLSFPLDIPVVEQRAIAAAIGRIAYARLLAGDAGDAAAIDANYVRRSDAEMNWKDEPVARTP